MEPTTIAFTPGQLAQEVRVHEDWLVYLSVPSRTEQGFVVFPGGGGLYLHEEDPPTGLAVGAWVWLDPRRPGLFRGFAQITEINGDSLSFGARCAT